MDEPLQFRDHLPHPGTFRFNDSIKGLIKFKGAIIFMVIVYYSKIDTD